MVPREMRQAGWRASEAPERGAPLGADGLGWRGAINGGIWVDFTWALFDQVASTYMPSDVFELMGCGCLSRGCCLTKR